MPAHISFLRHSRSLTKTHKIAVAGVATLGAAAVAFAAVPGDGHTNVSSVTPVHAPVKVGAQPAKDAKDLKDVKASVTNQFAGDSVKIQAIEARQQAAARHEAAHHAKEAASRSAQRPQMQTVAATTSVGHNLDGWIRQSLAIMRQHHIPGSYSGLHRNIMRESSGNPMAINNWDINAINGIPSKGLLQVIQPTFNTYHVSGTSRNIYDPVANITAAANYAAHRYGTIDNVNSAY
ncbi:transglycosylase SLT domain-containing protein [Streptomyces sp. NPDC046985]|uniref:transglycosylase SLT domain-containing protein n=1 Tax=Streptomyces sp. NPDC046985 TaxID=3155377 RepID=UPI0033E1C04A